jgi:uncharacterized protein YdhG (YjbR/CyaY superfamily)
MAKSNAKSVSEYIGLQPKGAQAALKRVRTAIRKAVPSAEELLSYNIPTYKLHGDAVLYFGGWKHHYSLYPATSRVVAAFKSDLAGYEVRKGTIRFPLSEPVPAGLIARIAKLRAKEVAQRHQVKAATPKRP